MRVYRFFCPTLRTGLNTLPVEEAHHAKTALRITPGQQVVLFDGAGGEASGRVVTVARHGLGVQVAELTRCENFDLPYRLTLCVALPKAHRQGYLIEKCTELGVAAIWPILTEHAITRPSAAALKKLARRAVEAAKQAQRRWVPQIAPAVAFEESLAHVTKFNLCALADCTEGARSLASWLADYAVRTAEESQNRSDAADGLALPAGGLAAGASAPVCTSLLLWIGPEGGWSEVERQQAAEAGLASVRLGPTILRTETAAVAACALCLLGIPA